MIDEEYEIESVVSAEPPTGMEGSDWYCYTIVQGTNKIVGYRQGSLSSVTTAVEENVNLLNERRRGKRGRAQLVMPATRKPAGQ